MSETLSFFLKAIFPGESLKELLTDLDHSSDYVELTLDKQRQLVLLQTRGPCGELEISAPASSDSEIVTSFRVDEPTGIVTAKYRMGLFRQVKEPWEMWAVDARLHLV
jgi:hypothetical protein